MFLYLIHSFFFRLFRNKFDLQSDAIFTWDAGVHFKIIVQALQRTHNSLELNISLAIKSIDIFLFLKNKKKQQVSTKRVAVVRNIWVILIPFMDRLFVKFKNVIWEFCHKFTNSTIRVSIDSFIYIFCMWIRIHNIDPNNFNEKFLISITVSLSLFRLLSVVFLLFFDFK